MSPEWWMILFAGLLAVGWSFINGCHRRNAAYKVNLAASVGAFPEFTKRKLLRLLAPTSFKDRWNHAIVIAGCVCIICTPAALALPFVLEIGWIKAFATLLEGSLAGSIVGEFVLNAWGCGLVMPCEPNPAQTGDAGGPSDPGQARR
jgi:hypothetical protein